MKDYNAQNNKFIKNGLVIIDRLLTEVERLKIDRVTDTSLLKFLDYFTSELEKVKITIEKNPRFDWINIQEKIDSLYDIDKNLTGIILYLDWFLGDNRALIKHKINKKD